MSKETGEPAFPVQQNGIGCTLLPINGITLCDYFAAKAMQGELSRKSGFETPSKVAEYAYEIADAMLEARESEGENMEWINCAESLPEPHQQVLVNDLNGEGVLIAWRSLWRAWEGGLLVNGSGYFRYKELKVRM